MRHKLEIKQFIKLIEYVEHRPGHKNSKGEPAPWVIISHETGEIISSHATEEEAKDHLRDIEIHKHM